MLGIMKICHLVKSKFLIMNDRHKLLPFPAALIHNKIFFYLIMDCLLIICLMLKKIFNFYKIPRDPGDSWNPDPDPGGPNPDPEISEIPITSNPK
jgi:hypothetical protein